MLEFIKRNRLLFIASGTLLMLILVLSARWGNSDRFQVVDKVFQTIAYPFQAVYSATTNAIGNATDNYIFLVRLKDENTQLRLRIQALEEELNHNINGAIQFNLLREQLKFMEEDPHQKVYAEVIGESVDNFHQTLLLNKGSNEGIRKNFPVVLREGVVGRIQGVSPYSSVVQLIVDRRHRFPVLIQRSRERMTVGGDGEKLKLVAPDRGLVVGSGQSLEMRRIRMLADVNQGDRVITSGLSGIFPKGLLVGYITQVGRKRHELFQKARLRPVVDFNKIEGVFVILRDTAQTNHPYFTQP